MHGYVALGSDYCERLGVTIFSRYRRRIASFWTRFLLEVDQPKKAINGFSLYGMPWMTAGGPVLTHASLQAFLDYNEKYNAGVWEPVPVFDSTADYSQVLAGHPGRGRPGRRAAGGGGVGAPGKLDGTEWRELHKPVPIDGARLVLRTAPISRLRSRRMKGTCRIVSDVPVRCQFCGEDRLLERVSAAWWFCSVCGRTFEVKGAQ